MTDSNNDSKIKDLLKLNHDGKEYDENELSQVVKTIISQIKINGTDNESELIASVVQYVYYSKNGKYNFNFKRKQTKKPDYHNKIVDTVKELFAQETLDPTSDELEALEKEIFMKNEPAISKMAEPIKEIQINIIENEIKQTGNYVYPANFPFKLTRNTQDIFEPFGTQWYHDVQTDDILDEKALAFSKKFDILRAIKVPEQGTPGWFAMRSGKITASDGGTVLEDNPYEAPYKFILKKTTDTPFLSNEFVHHGKKYEEISTMIYEYRMNIATDEFGLIGHFKYDFLGASPDRIGNKYKLDGIHLSKYVGRMLEIKCPYVRQIQMSGAVIDNICPKYYWVQVQLQLECCDLEECDFWQTEIREYESRQEFIQDTDPNEPFRSLKTKFEKGCVIQLLPRKHMNDIIEGKYKNVVYESSKYIYPPKIEMTPYDCDVWITKSLTEINNNHKYNDYFFDKVVYWKLTRSKNVLINRDRKWFAESLPKLKLMWDYVLFLRSNPDKLKILIDYIDSRKIKRNKEIMAVVTKLYDVKDPNYNTYIKMILDDTLNGKTKKETIIEDPNDYMFIDPKKQSKPVAAEPKKYNQYNNSFKTPFVKQKPKADNDDYMFV